MGNVVKSLGAHQMMSVLFNHFLAVYSKTQEHDPAVESITNMVSKILNKRKKNKTNDVAMSSNLSSMPPQIIGECASYLDQDDYFDFSFVNRTIYCATDCPITLTELDITNVNDYSKMNLQRFS